MGVKGPLVVAVEGVDRCGKTTLLKNMMVIEPFKFWPMFKLQVPPAVLSGIDTVVGGQTIEAYARAFNDALVTMRKTISFLTDRSFVSSIIYSTLFGRPIDWQYVTHLATELAPIIIYVRPPLDVVVERMRTVGDDYVKEAHVRQAYALYEDWYKKPRYGREQKAAIDPTAFSTPEAAAQVVAEWIKAV
jgi:thymidylate kinase